VLAHALEFLQANASSLDLCKGSRTYAFKWLQLADAAGLTDACKACADCIIDLDRSSCATDNTQGLSPQTLTYLLDKCATAAPNFGCLGSSSASCGCQLAAKASGFGVAQDICGIGIGVAAGYGDTGGGCCSCAHTRALTRFQVVCACQECGRVV
jgi:hypothetical protein